MGETTVVPFERPQESCVAYAHPPGEFADGWAMLWNTKPHWFRFVRDGDTVIATSPCGIARVGKVTAQIAEPGNFPRCKRCIAHLRRGTHGLT